MQVSTSLRVNQTDGPYYTITEADIQPGRQTDRHKQTSTKQKQTKNIQKTKKDTERKQETTRLFSVGGHGSRDPLPFLAGVNIAAGEPD